MCVSETCVQFFINFFLLYPTIRLEIERQKVHNICDAESAVALDNVMSMKICHQHLLL